MVLYFNTMILVHYYFFNTNQIIKMTFDFLINI